MSTMADSVLPTPNTEIEFPEKAYSAPSTFLDNTDKDIPSTPDSQTEDEPTKPSIPPFNPDYRFYLAFASLCVIILMAALDATSLSVDLSTIASTLQGTAIEAFWAGTSFLLTSTVFQPVIGSLSSLFGRKPLLYTSLVFFGVGAIVAAVAKRGDGMAMLLIGRSIQGIGGGGIIVLAEILTTDLVPLRQRGNYQSIIGMMWALGSVGGPLIGEIISFLFLFVLSPCLLLFFITLLHPSHITLIALFHKSYIPLTSLSHFPCPCFTYISLPPAPYNKLQKIVEMIWNKQLTYDPITGGVLAEKATWRWIFWINLPFIGVGSVAIALFLKLTPPSGKLAARLRRVDWIGCILFVGSTVGILIPLTWGGVMYPWSHWRTLVPLLVSIAGLATFVVWEEKFAKEPLIPFRVVKNRTAATNYLGTFLHGLILWCQLYYMPLYYEAVKGFSPIISGVALFPATFTVAPAAIVVGILVTVTGRYRWAIWVGWLFATLGTGLQILLDVKTSIPAWIFINLIPGIGTGMLFPSTMFGVQAATPSKDMSAAVAFFTFSRSFGQAVGVAIGGVIFQNQIKKKIMQHALIASHADEWAADASGLVEIIKAMADGPVRDQLIESYADALKIVWAVICGLAFVGLVTSFLTQHFSLDRPLETDQGFVTVEKVRDEEK